MKILLTQTAPSGEDVNKKLTAKYPNYKVWNRQKSLIIVQKSGTAAATVLIRKNSILVNEGFPSMGATLLFVLCVVFLGILIPLIIYFAAFYSSQKAVRNEVAEYLKGEYGAK